MIQKLFITNLVFFNILGYSQNILTYVGNSALVTVKSNTLVYNGGGLQTAGTGIVNNSGNIMINGVAADGLTIAPTSVLRMVAAGTTAATDYGQLYIAGITQSNISGKVHKEYRSEYLNGNTTTNTGRQQIGLPFYQFTIPELVNAFGTGNLNVTNTDGSSSGRFSVASAFWWNSARARFDQVANGASAYDAAGNPNAAFINPMTYYILPRAKTSGGTAFWTPNGETKTFIGTPASDQTLTNVEFKLSGAYSGSFGTNGGSENFFREKYSSYIDDPFRSKTPSWSTDYAMNLYQIANPFLTNLDLKYIAQNETGTLSDGNNITNLEGIAYYTSGNISWAIRTGSTYSTASIAMLSAGVFQAGNTTATVIRPLGAFMVKLNSATPQTLNFNGTRRFKYSSRAAGVNNGVTAARLTKESSEEGTVVNNIPADKIVKQVAVVMYDLDGEELDRTYYAVSPSAVTGKSTSTSLQAYSAEKKIYTREEKNDGGLDADYVDNLYINEANELDFKSKQIPLYVKYDEPYQLKFEVYEKGERVADGLSNGNSFYFKNPEGKFVKIVDGYHISYMNGDQSNLGLYYELPEEGTLGTSNLTSGSQTIVAKKGTNWIVKFAKDWKNATVEVYSASGQLLNSKSQISTASDYSIPLNYQSKSVFLVKATSEKGEVVIKKIIN